MRLAARAARKAGFTGERLVEMVAVGEAESGCNPLAVGDKKLVDHTWGPSIGIWQVRSLRAHQGTGQERDGLRLPDPDFNARSAWSISKSGTDLTPWSVYRSGAYLKHVAAARAAVGDSEGQWTMNFVPRAEWEARSPRSSSSLDTGMVTVHWAGTPSGNPDHDDCAGVVRSFQAYHMNTHGWADIAYNLIVCAHGYIFEGRGRGRRSAANGTNSANGASYAICYLLGEGEPFTDEAKDAINEAALYLVPGGPEWRVHGDWVDTTCPGPAIAAWVRDGHPRSNTTTTEVPQVSPSAFRYIDGTDWLFDAPSGIHQPLGSDEQLKFLDDLGVVEKGRVARSVVDMLILAVPRKGDSGE